MFCAVSDNSPVVVIMSGGLGRRLARPSHGIPKPLLRAHDEPLIARQVRQALDAHTHVLVTTRPEYVPDFRACLSRRGLSGSPVRVVGNPRHPDGPLPALQYIADSVPVAPSRPLVVSFGDTFYLRNPFRYVLSASARCSSMLLGGEELGPAKRRAGVIHIGPGQRVRRIAYDSVEGARRRWSGMTIWASPFVDMLEAFLRREALDSVEEAFLQYCVSRGVHLRYVDGPPFINVNSARDLAAASRLRRQQLGV